MFKRSLLSITVSSLLMSSYAFSQTPIWVEENTENAEGIITNNAPEKPPVTVNLSKVIVTGALKEELAIAESAASIAHFGVKEVDRLNATSLSELFAYEPGVTVDEGISGGLNDIRIRGMGSDRVLISIDGAPLPMTYSFGSYLDTNRNYFDLDAMKSVDIIKGPMSTLYGGSALAGGIFMQTKDPLDFIKAGKQIGGEAKVGYRSASDELLISGTVAGKFTDKLSAFTRLTYLAPHERRNHAGKASSESLMGPDRTHPDAADAKSYNSLSKIVFEPNENHRFSLSYEYFKETLNVDPYSKFGLVTMNSFKQLTLHTKDINKRRQLNLRHDFDLPTMLFDRGFWQVYYQKSEAEQWSHEVRESIPRPNRPVVVSARDRYSSFTNRNVGLMAEFTKGWEQNAAMYHNFTYGINYIDRKVSTLREGDTINLANGVSTESEAFPNKGFPDSKIKELGLFLQDRVSFFDGQFEAIAGIRYDQYKLNPTQGSVYETANPGVLPPSKMNEHHFSKRLALLWHPTEENTFFINYSEGFRAPSFSAVNVGFGNPLYGYISRSNPNLKPEKSRSYEIGWNYLDDHQSFAVTGFYTNYKNFIEELSPVGTDPQTGYMLYQAVNLGKSRIYGLEIKAQKDLFTIQNGSGVIGLNASLAYAKGKEKGTNDPINSVEPLTAVVGIDYTYLDQLYLSARVKGVQAKKEKDISANMLKTGTTATGGYATVDLIGEYKPAKDITLNGGLYNVFNKKYHSWGPNSWYNNMTGISQQERDRATNPGFNVAFSIKIDL
ncbi:TonB-dependent hemoglobin/transferrin/lactoferrin family receptor [Ignatzschineria rhizosphaerae]|uniref:TonB-dependent hemoglobin/transferrin/lactoferrin family receptor n=1 Tax=Ignatzschineria rhizosphaerae TaxID=2923279 RepID=A0ABY3X5R5_9GAMM|nr:TonB-dependent hemoglobin/transferrin/lactoferrin family receptor [Ignatzschineria rhizosphaerae]UNM95343.1 TonB-dependent hemoglobin/transferrin/lactoferrin family receptor [Ignatzschineria rhizosphaerae]